ncbi:hypothetical protein EMIHUDRAFT_113665 [Emiliania huxleyi CCMP1516]|uniref:DDE Tnp4 domain-containing protein n=2 Tax=Emiliania huxleyi TaxID=2903 RepID=A0A0D3K1J7_EMIH1|nr:hypothetical protein EMIHUDRAFT_113665 [Emiliania huxleyi CCMP1516]EOD29632.1 hypothetical protein EMIHUDRAFT_113665 [Emiliania huxleyi CCMP1516]|eukprot:XP_005782061.1 hypothetical protein EMIHUDRAFT_113665 [Emiliania huxleyi CCMP1516]
MPSRAYFLGELLESKFFFGMANMLDSDSESDFDVQDELVVTGVEPLMRRRTQEIGPERLSVARLQREAAARGHAGDDVSSATYQNYGFHLRWLPIVIAALMVPAVIQTVGGHLFTGEEAVLLLLLRFRSDDGFDKMTWTTGRNISALSEVEHVHNTFPHLVNHRSFSSWSPHFHQFAQAFTDYGLPIQNLIGFIDGKLWAVCRPGRYQNVLYSGHKRIHGIKTQGIIFPNGMQPYPFGPVNGSRHDSTVLSRSRIVQILHDLCRGGPFAWMPGGLGQDYCLFGDSAYPISAFLWRMYKGAMTPAQQFFNSTMSPARVTVEWGFGKIVNLWPFLDYRKKSKARPLTPPHTHALQVLLSPVGLYFPVANVLTNMHTCLARGNIVSYEFGLAPPELHEYMRGGPYSCEPHDIF